MIIQRSTASNLLKQSLVVVDVNGKIRKDVKSIDTSSMVVTLGDDSTVDGGEFYFVVTSESDRSLLEGEIDVELHFLISVDADGPPKKSLDISDSAEFLSVIWRCIPNICQCSNCDTYFLIFVDHEQNIWTIDKTDGDTLFTMTKVTGSISCDNCSATVTVLLPGTK